MLRRFSSHPLLYVLLNVLIFLTKCYSLNSGTLHNCSEDSCNTMLANHRCLVSSKSCECPSSNGSFCNTLDQQTFVNLTGAQSENASKWTCCFCRSAESYCCNKCNLTTVSTIVHLPATFFRLLVVFVLDCNKYLTDEPKLIASIRQGIINITSMPFDSVTVENVSCRTGEQPFCGMDHHRAKRLAAAGSARAEGSSKKKSDGTILKNYQYNFNVPVVDLRCESLTANITVRDNNSTFLELTLDLLQRLQINNSLEFSLWNGQSISSSFMLSAMKGASYTLHEAPSTVAPIHLTEEMPPIKMDLKPMIYTCGAILGLVTTCVLWKLIKHSWLLRKNKFTAINSNRVSREKARHLEKVMEAMEENSLAKFANGNALTTTFSGLPRSDGGLPTMPSNWSSPGYLPSTLTPAYKPTELHNQRSPPRLILDEGSDAEDRLSIGSVSIPNADNDNLSDILNSDEETALRFSNGRQASINGLENLGFSPNQEKFVTSNYSEEVIKDLAISHSTSGQKRKTSRQVKANTKAAVYANDNQDEDGELSLPSNSDEDDKKFLSPKRKEKKKKKRDVGNKVKKAAKKGGRRKSFTSSEVDESSQSSFEVSDGANKTRKKSFTPLEADDSLQNSLGVCQEGNKTRKASLKVSEDNIKGKMDFLTPTSKEKKRRRSSITPEPRQRKNSTEPDVDVEGKVKKKKGDEQKTKTKKKTTALEDSEEETGEHNTAQLRVNPTPETKRRKSLIPEDAKAERKKKKEVEKRRKKGNIEKSEELEKGSEPSAIQLRAYSSAETKRRNSACVDEDTVKGKKKRQREAIEKKRKLGKKGEADDEAKDAVDEILTVKDWRPKEGGTSEIERRKSMIAEEMTTETKGRKPKGEREKKWGGETEAREDGVRRPSAQMKANRISPTPTGYKSPTLLIKPSYRHY